MDGPPSRKFEWNNLIFNKNFFTIMHEFAIKAEFIICVLAIKIVNQNLISF